MVLALVLFATMLLPTATLEKKPITEFPFSISSHDNGNVFQEANSQNVFFLSQLYQTGVPWLH